ncbi:MAG: hypothetical protein SF187_08055 [Deltaproteobacteria bacterium]|nr:hypothetical protein [Deltaproteobacteria bacterium]
MRLWHVAQRLCFPQRLWLLCATLACGSCDSLSSFEGNWEGKVSADPNLRQGFVANDHLAMNITALGDGSLDMTLRLPNQTSALRFESVRRASSDALGSMSLPGDPLRNYLGYVRPAGQEAILVVVSLFPPDHVEARLVRGPDEVYGVFRLSKAK